MTTDADLQNLAAQIASDASHDIGWLAPVSGRGLGHYFTQYPLTLCGRSRRRASYVVNDVHPKRCRTCARMLEVKV
ncbi:MAG: hypothetical protein ACREWE_00085 [Gammaproteobacteria bacterium]